MATSFLGFRGRGDWVFDSLAEFWFGILVKRQVFQESDEQWVKDFVKEVNNALEAKWIMGVVTCALDKYLTDDQRIAFMAGESVALNKELRRLAEKTDWLKYDGAEVSSEYLVKQLDLIDNLFLDPEKVPLDPTKQN